MKKIKLEPKTLVENVGYVNECTTLFVEHLHHGEYVLPQCNPVTQRIAWDGFEIMEAFEDYLEAINVKTENNEFNDTIQTLMRLTFDNRAKKIKEKYGQELTLQCDHDYTSTILHITLWLYGDRKKEVLKWLQEIYDSACYAYLNSSGDDDFYDYMPGYLQCVAEIMNMTGNPDHEKSLLYIINHCEDLEDEGLSREQIISNSQGLE